MESEAGHNLNLNNMGQGDITNNDTPTVQRWTVDPGTPKPLPPTPGAPSKRRVHVLRQVRGQPRRLVLSEELDTEE